jgi:hypothetical protein
LAPCTETPTPHVVVARHAGRGWSCGARGDARWWRGRKLQEDVVGYVPKGVENVTTINLHTRILKVVAHLKEVSLLEGRKEVYAPLLPSLIVCESFNDLSVDILEQSSNAPLTSNRGAGYLGSEVLKEWQSNGDITRLHGLADSGDELKTGSLDSQLVSQLRVLGRHLGLQLESGLRLGGGS